jgi:hypothetical protein
MQAGGSCIQVFGERRAELERTRQIPDAQTPDHDGRGFSPNTGD